MQKRFGLYVGILIAVLIAASVQLDWSTLQTLGPLHLAGFGVLLALAVLSEYVSIPLLAGSGAGSYSLIFLFLYGSVLFLGPAATVLIAVVAHAVSELYHGTERIKSLFNVVQHGLSTALAGQVFLLLGGQASTEVFEPSLLAFGGFALVHTLCNLFLVAIAFSILQGLSVSRWAVRLAGPWGAGLFYDLLVTPLAVMLAWAYTEFWIWGLFGVVFPVFLVRGAYLTNFKLQQTNRDLLKALVKAIETRDPYTSGHSVRVSTLAKEVAVAANLPVRSVDHVETAALLHDVGKIDAIYTDILKKPGSLSDSEWEIIKSHVDKGVELLTSLSSFHPAVIASVRHHHERFDGSGYPDGVKGLDIPLGARIIKICDAVDAMLSDRPYRKALSLPDVREQLLLFAEREFDPALVSLFFKEGILERHAETLAADMAEIGLALRRKSSADSPVVGNTPQPA